jgi:hypothetical protein
MCAYYIHCGLHAKSASHDQKKNQLNLKELIYAMCNNGPWVHQVGDWLGWSTLGPCSQAVCEVGVLGQAMIFSSMNNLNTENTFVDLTE